MEKYCSGVLISRCQAATSLTSQAYPQHKSCPAQSKDVFFFLIAAIKKVRTVTF